jgi:hypothetical protein
MSSVHNNQSFCVFKQQQMMEQLNKKSVKTMEIIIERSSLTTIKFWMENSTVGWFDEKLTLSHLDSHYLCFSFIDRNKFEA